MTSQCVCFNLNRFPMDCFNNAKWEMKRVRTTDYKTPRLKTNKISRR